MKKQAISENRVNFENARRILFGTDLIPGTNRERWTTAGTFELKFHPPQTFTLGPYNFDFLGGSIYINSKLEDHPTIIFQKDHLKITWPSLKYPLLSNFRTTKIGGFFQHENKIYYNISFSQDVNTSMGGYIEAPILNGNVLPNDDAKLIEYYKKTKNMPRLAFKLDVGDKTLLLVQHNEIPEGIVKYQDMTCVFSAGLVGLQVGVTGVVPWQHIKPYFTKSSNDICEYEDGKFWFYDDLAYIAEAIDWLMHVLTGPDPRNYDARPFDNQDVPLKEDSEPRRRYFTFEKDQYGIYHMKGKKYPRFFVLDNRGMTIIDAKLIRNAVTHFLMNIYGADGFGHGLEEFLKGDMENAPYTADEFNAAIARIDRFDQYEYLGCVVCGEESSKKCGNCNQLYCGEECQKLHWEQGHNLQCL